MHLARLAVAVSAALFSVAAGADDLMEIYQRARTKDATYSAAQATWQASREKVPQGLALLLPTASIAADTNFNDRTIDFRNGISAIDKYNNHSATATVVQPVFRWQNLVQYEQSKLQQLQADAQLAAAEQELILRVAQAYFEILLAATNVELARAQKESLGIQLAQAKKNFDVGSGTITDVHEAQGRLDLVAAQEVAALRDLDSRQRVIEQIIGAPAPPVVPIRRDFPLLPPEPNSMDAWVEQAMQDSQQVRIQLAAQEFARKEVERNRAGHLPTVDVVASYLKSGTGAGDLGGVGNDTTNSSIGVRLAVPVFQGGAVNSRVREAAANLTRAGDELEAARRAAALGVRQGFIGVTTGISQVTALRSAVVSSQRQYDSTQLGRRAGVRTNIDVLNAQQQVFSAQRDLAEAVHSYILSGLRLKLAAGVLSDGDVARVNSWLGVTPLPPTGAPAGGNGAKTSPPSGTGPARAQPR